MQITQIGPQWFRLVSEGEPNLVWWGYSKKEVVGKFQSYVRELDLDKIRYRPKYTVFTTSTEEWA